MPKNATVSQKKCSVAWLSGRRSRTAAPTSSEKMPTAASSVVQAARRPTGSAATRDVDHAAAARMRSDRVVQRLTRRGARAGPLSPRSTPIDRAARRSRAACRRARCPLARRRCRPRPPRRRRRRPRPPRTPSSSSVQRRALRDVCSRQAQQRDRPAPFAPCTRNERRFAVRWWVMRTAGVSSRAKQSPYPGQTQLGRSNSLCFNDL